MGIFVHMRYVRCGDYYNEPYPYYCDYYDYYDPYYYYPHYIDSKELYQKSGGILALMSMIL